MDEKKKTCFMIQEFDGKTFDKRFKETFKPAISKCGLIPLRADEILGLQPVIEKIEENINKTNICLADVSTNNPNVWLELGYALAINKPVVIICDNSYRNKLPFDIQHRPVIFYESDSKSGYDELEKKIAELIDNELKTGIKTQKYVKDLGTKLPDNLDDFEIEIIGVLISKWDGKNNGCSRWEIENHMRNAGYNDLSIGLGLSSLSNKLLIEQKSVEIDDHNNEPYMQDVHLLTDSGLEWIEKNRSIFSTQVIKNIKSLDDDIPF